MVGRKDDKSAWAGCWRECVLDPTEFEGEAFQFAQTARWLAQRIEVRLDRLGGQLLRGCALDRRIQDFKLFTGAGCRPSTDLIKRTQATFAGAISGDRANTDAGGRNRHSKTGIKAGKKTILLTAS